MFKEQERMAVAGAAFATGAGGGVPRVLAGNGAAGVPCGSNGGAGVGLEGIGVVWGSLWC